MAKHLKNCPTDEFSEVTGSRPAKHRRPPDGPPMLVLDNGAQDLERKIQKQNLARKLRLRRDTPIYDALKAEREM